MKIKAVFYHVGNLLKVEAGLMALPLLISVIDADGNYLAFLIAIAALLALGFLLTRLGRKDAPLYAREGFTIVGISWLLISLFGALPFVISGEIPNFIDAFFEATSGFTTTGATILRDVEALSRSMLFWRSFTQWIGGMGILLFVLAFMPTTEARSIFIMKAESPGPKVGKIVAKVKITARILYAIYIVLTILLIILLSFKLPFFDSVTHALSAAGTGGFSIKNAGIAYYDSAYVEVVLTVFMFLFGINFTVFYLLLIGKVGQALKSEELRWYAMIVLVTTVMIAATCFRLYNSVGMTLRHAAFQTVSVMTTTGFSTVDFAAWPAFAQTLLIILMFIGACAGSTSGGLKVSRVVIYFKMILKEIKYSIHPHQVTTVLFEREPLDESVQKGVAHHFIAYLFILVLGTLLVSLDGFSFTTNFTAVLTTLSNIGPGLDTVGPLGNFAAFGPVSKIIFALIMTAGRLEIFPLLVLFSPRVWKYR
jgi:trk system potassium uptake protein TrkH